MSKYQKTDTVFALKTKKGSVVNVIPFDAEKFYLAPSWSHGFTHLMFEDGSYYGFCGQDYFENKAEEIKTILFKIPTPNKESYYQKYRGK